MSYVLPSVTVISDLDDGISPVFYGLISFSEVSYYLCLFLGACLLLELELFEGARSLLYSLMNLTV